MKIGFYTPSWPPGSPPNGIATYVASLVAQMEAAGSQVSIFSSNCDSEAVSSSFSGQIIDLNQYWSRRAFLTAKLANIIRPGYELDYPIAMPLKNALIQHHKRYGLDVFEIEESFGWARWLSPIKNVLKVVRLHGPHFLMVNTRVNSRPSAEDEYRINCEKKAILSADLVTAPSSNVLQETRIYYDLPLDNAVIVPNGVSMPDAAQRWSLSECDPNMLLFVGRFDRVKGGDIVLRAFDLLSKRNPDLKLVFVGPDYGCEGANGKVQNVQEFIADNLSEYAASNVVLKGFQTPEEILKLRRLARATLVTSRYEVFGYNGLEALAMACPLVCSRAGGLTELYEDGRSALGFDSESVDELAAQTQKILDDQNLSCTLSQEAFTYCQENFDVSRVVEKTIAAYKKNL